MYFNKDNNFYHGIMFHHFHDDKIHKNSPGSISKDELLKIINFIGKKNILDADIFFDKFTKKKLSEQEVCFTFDDGIKSQIDVALPVLEDFKIKSFFFVHTAIFDGKPDNLEILSLLESMTKHSISVYGVTSTVLLYILIFFLEESLRSEIIWKAALPICPAPNIATFVIVTPLTKHLFSEQAYVPVHELGQR